MESTKLQVRLSIPTRDRILVEKFAKVLSKLGFTVETISDRGVSFKGDKDDLERIFDSSIRSQANNYAFDKPPKLPSGINSNGASIYLPTKPSFYSN